MKEMKDKTGNITGYEIENSVLIHSHISDPESWFVTIRPIQIYGEFLCLNNKRRNEQNIRKKNKIITML